MTSTSSAIGILAYGSLIDDPGDELGPRIRRVVRDVITPFPVEFARMSASRGDAPTLVPYPEGACVSAAILIVDATEEEATDMLWRRETRIADTSRPYPGKRANRPNAVTVEAIDEFSGVRRVLYTDLAANIAPLTAKRLAELAIASVASAKPGLDGISYLAAAKRNLIVTPLSPAYEAAILKLTDTTYLDQAHAQARWAANEL